MTDQLEKLLNAGCSDIQRTFDVLTGDIPKLLPDRGCVFWSIAVYRYLKQKGVDCLLQAGSAYFQHMAPGSEGDDGVCDTHFSYVCQDGPAFVAEAKQRQALPEMHSWVVVRSGSSVIFIDWTTRYLISLCEQKGVPWKQPTPPDVLVAEPEAWPDGWRYEPKQVPTAFLAQVERSLPKP